MLVNGQKMHIGAGLFDALSDGFRLAMGVAVTRMINDRDVSHNELQM